MSEIGIKERRCFTWQIRQRDRRSHHFSFLDSMWRLAFYHSTRSNYNRLYLEEAKFLPPSRTFEVTCFARDRTIRDGVFGITHNKQIACEGNEYPYAAVIWEDPNDPFRTRDEIEFVIILHGGGGTGSTSSTSSKTTANKCVNTCLDASMESLATDLRNLLASGDASDVQLRCGGGAATRPAHRSVLAARSEVFSAMFRNKMAESISGLVDIEDLDETLLDPFLAYVYTGNLADIPEGRAHELYVVADRYAVHCLKKTCSDRMLESLTSDNYQTFLVTADAHGNGEFKDALKEAVTEHPDWLNCQKWSEFSKEHPGG